MTPTDFALILGAALSLHRIWNYETTLKNAVERIKPLSCAACNAFWVGLAATALWYFAHPFVVATVACYLPVRVLAWWYAKQFETPTVAAVKPPLPAARPTVAAVPPVKVYERTIIILTALNDFRSSYSVAQEVANSARGIAKANPSCGIQVWVMQGATADHGGMPGNVQVLPIIPRITFVEDKYNDTDVHTLTEWLRTALRPYKHADVITHDLMFISWFLTFSKAIHSVGKIPGIRWWHVCHSMPGSRDHVPAERCNLPDDSHSVITVSQPGIDRFKTYYNTDRVCHIPNVRDPRTLGMPQYASEIADKMKLWDASAVQILPVCSTRMEAKGVHKVIRLFAHLHRLGSTAKLVVCNPNASGDVATASLARLRKLVKYYNLDGFVGFTSDLIPSLAVSGLPSADVSALMNGYGNVFAFPSISESDGLVLLEARLARQFILVNADASGIGTAHADLMNLDAGVAIHWGATADKGDTAEVAEFAAQRILQHFSTDAQEMSRRQVLRTRHLEGIGNQWGSLLASTGPA